MTTKKKIWRVFGIIIFIYMIYRGFTFEVEPKIETFDNIFTDYEMQLELLGDKVLPLYSIGSDKKIGKVSFTEENGNLFIEIESGSDEGIGAINREYHFKGIHTEKVELVTKTFGDNIIWIAEQNDYGIVVSLGKKEWLSQLEFNFLFSSFFTVSVLSKKEMGYFMQGTMGNKTNYSVYVSAYDMEQSGLLFPYCS